MKRTLTTGDDMTEEELNRLEAMARPMEGATSSMVIPGDYVLSLIALARVGLAVTPRPISEAPKDKAYAALIYGGTERFWDEIAIEWRAHAPRWDVAHFLVGKKTWISRDTFHSPDFFIPLSALPKPGGE